MKVIAVGLGCFLFLGMLPEGGAGPSTPPRYVGPPEGDRVVTNRALTMVSSLAISPEGRLWVTWYAGPTPREDINNYVVLATSGDDGETWEEILVVDPDDFGEPIRAFDPMVWVDPNGHLWLIWAQARQHGIDAQTWVMVTEDPESANPEWSDPRIIAPGVMMCKPIVMEDGTWLFPVSDWEGRRERIPDAATSGAWVSYDDGETFSKRGAALVPVEERTFDEQMFIERKDGSLWMLVRTRYGIGESVSTDGGRTWPEVTPSGIPHPPARFFITRLESGNLLLVKHGPMDERTGRSHLMAFISGDDGETWDGGLLLDERSRISYPDGQQAEDGRIFITYDHSRTGEREILFAVFREEDAAAGESVSGDVRLRQLVSKGSGGIQPDQDERPRAVEQVRTEELRVPPDGVEFQRDNPGAWSEDQFDAIPFEPRASVFSDRLHRVANVPEELEGALLLRIPLDGTKTLTVAREGTLYVLTPRPDRNRDSQSEALERQGFKPVALPEIPLFFHQPGTTANHCTLYQAELSSGETIRLGKWAVPIFFP